MPLYAHQAGPVCRLHITLFHQICTTPPSNLLAGLLNCMRIKLDMTAANKALRDPVCFRCNPTHHWRTKDKYKVGVWVFVRFILRILYLNVNEAEDRTALHIHPLPAHQGYVQGR